MTLLKLAFLAAVLLFVCSIGVLVALARGFSNIPEDER